MLFIPIKIYVIMTKNNCLGFLLILAMGLFYSSCSKEAEHNTDGVNAQESLSAAVYIKEQLEQYPNNDFENLVQLYGEPAWEYAHIRGG